MKKLWLVSVGVAFLFTITIPSRAQEAPDISGDANSPSDFETELRAVEATTPLPAADVPDVGNFLSAKHAMDWPPFPDSMGLPAWNLGDGFYILDDLGVNYSAAASNGMLAMDDFSGESSANTNFFIGIERTNIIVSWISRTNKIYLLEDRATLTSETHWGELQNYLLAAENTNVTSFVHTNILQSQPTDFYRLFDVTPVARADFFAIDQDSSDNQFDIFQNDSDPNDDLFYISNLVPAHHGSINYSLDATTFQYTPDSGFYGVDSFAYSITSGYGDISSNATVTVFVNQSGNSPPSVNDLIITLQTNIYTATFNALTNSSDPDGDTPILFSVNSPSLGSVSNDASGNITYNRNPNVFGNDAFTYIITDGKGGYTVGNVKICNWIRTATECLTSGKWQTASTRQPTIQWAILMLMVCRTLRNFNLEQTLMALTTR
ncbi:MAG TPA: Ig-like domain-containing protein [Verrucomicrobiae bacterium]